MEEAFEALTRLANERFAHYLRILPGPTPAHRVSFSRRITTSWALIYYRRHVVRLSPYLFLLDADDLKHASHWQELDATLRHEAVHASLFALTGQTDHGGPFTRMLEAIGVEANGRCDLGPENVAFRYVYACPSCSEVWHRRTPLRGNWSCGVCSPGRYEPRHRMMLEARQDPWHRMRARLPLVREAVAEAMMAPLPDIPLDRRVELRRACTAASTLAPRGLAAELRAARGSDTGDR